MNFTFYVDCGMCGRRISAASKVVLGFNVNEHAAKCRPATTKKNDAKLAAAARDAAQGSLFPKG